MKRTKIMFAGDLIPDLKDSSINSNLFEIINDSELSFVNLESPITNSNKRILKTGNCFKVEIDTAINTLDQLPFKVFCLANNHIMDFGSEGLSDTIDVLSKKNFGICGAGSDLAQAYTIYDYFSDDVRLGFINVTENEFSSSTHQHAGAAGFDLITLLQVFSHYTAKYDHLFLIYHGGIEYYPYPSPRIRKLFRFLIESGFSGIICHHSHIFSCFEIYDNKPIFYGIGNFFAPMNRIMPTAYYQSALVELNLSKLEISIDVIPIINDSRQKSIRLMDELEHRMFIAELSKRNKLLEKSEILDKEWRLFLDSKKSYYSDSVDWTGNRIVKKMRKLGLLPKVNYASFRALKLLNFLRCEAHNEALVDLISKELSKIDQK